MRTQTLQNRFASLSLKVSKFTLGNHIKPFFFFFNVITCIGIDLLYNFCELIHLATFQRCVKNKRRCVKIEMWFFYPRRVFILPSRCLMNAFGWDFAFMVSLRLRIKFVFSMLKFRNKICWQLVFIASRSIYTQHKHIFFFTFVLFCFVIILI